MTDTNAQDLRSEILIIEDDPEIRRFLRTTLTAEEYRLQEATTAAEGIARATRRPPDAIVLDLGLPDADGLEVIRQIREWNKSLPIIVLSVRARERDKIIALDAGADDFVNKPFAVGELLARLRVALRRNIAVPESGDSTIFRTGDIEVDFSKRRVLRQGKEVRLTRTEYKLLQVLVLHADQVLTHSQLLNAVWGPNCEDQSHYVRVYMGQLRLKLETDPARPKYLRTEPGVGYRLNVR
ncbi:MAG TPA: response regulator [Terriglobia bacterium]|nr:response regulator [Terriglobia bacterium]